jgi:hypothetical protein
MYETYLRNGTVLAFRYLGESEVRIRVLFELAAELVPCVIFIGKVANEHYIPKKIFLLCLLLSMSFSIQMKWTP